MLVSNGLATGDRPGHSGDQDPPRRARSQRTDSEYPRHTGHGPYLRGSIIVKFRAGTAPTAERAMLARVTGRQPARFRTRTSTSSRSMPRPIRKRWQGDSRPSRTSNTRRHDTCVPVLRAERPALLAAVELPRHRHGARVGHQPRRRRPRSRRRAGQRRGVPVGRGALQRGGR